MDVVRDDGGVLVCYGRVTYGCEVLVHLGGHGGLDVVVRVAGGDTVRVCSEVGGYHTFWWRGRHLYSNL